MKYKKIELIIQSNENGWVYDVSELSSKVTLKQNIKGSASTLTFDVNTNVHKFEVPLGSVVSFKVDNKGQFFGYVFKTKPDGQSVQITAYDQLRYLKNNETYILNNFTITKLLKNIAYDFKLRVGYIEDNGFILPKRIEDNKSLGDIIKRAIDNVLLNTGRKLILRDEYGVMVLRDVQKLVTNVIIGDDSLLNTYDYEENIDNNSYNTVKLYKDNKDSGKREIYIVKDSNNIKKWGKLQYFKSVDENMNTTQIKDKASKLLEFYNEKEKKIKLDCIGVLGLMAGDGVRLRLNDIPQIKLDQTVLVTDITHKFQNGSHSMKLEVEL